METLKGTYRHLRRSCLALLFNYYTYVNSEVSYRIADSPDENSALYSSKLIAEDSSLIWHSEMNERYNVSYFRPRNSIDIGDNNYIGPYAGFQMLLGYGKIIWAYRSHSGPDRMYRCIVPISACKEHMMRELQ